MGVSWRDAAEASHAQRSAMAAWRRALAAGDVPLVDLFRERPVCFGSWSLLDMLRLGQRWGRLRTANMNAAAVRDGVNLAITLARAPSSTLEWLVAHLDGTAPPKPRKSRAREAANMRLPSGPFADWVSGFVERVGIDEVATLTRLDKRTIYSALRRERPTVLLSTVDRALLEADTNLCDLYPDLFEDEAVAA